MLCRTLYLILSAWLYLIFCNYSTAYTPFRPIVALPLAESSLAGPSSRRCNWVSLISRAVFAFKKPCHKQTMPSSRRVPKLITLDVSHQKNQEKIRHSVALKMACVAWLHRGRVCYLKLETARAKERKMVESIGFGSSPVDRAGEDHSHTLSRSQPGLNGEINVPGYLSLSLRHACQHMRDLCLADSVIH